MADQKKTTIYAKPHPFTFISESVIGMATFSDPDTMTLDEAMTAPYKNEFIQAM